MSKRLVFALRRLHHSRHRRGQQWLGHRHLLRRLHGRRLLKRRNRQRRDAEYSASGIRALVGHVDVKIQIICAMSQKMKNSYFCWFSREPVLFVLYWISECYLASLFFGPFLLPDVLWTNFWKSFLDLMCLCIGASPSHYTPILRLHLWLWDWDSMKTYSRMNGPVQLYTF